MDKADTVVKPLMVKDLRVQLRARGLSPAGGTDELRERLKEHMIKTNNFAVDLGGAAPPPEDAGAHLSPNNYARPGGQQNVGNRITDRPSSKVLAPPGGSSQVVLGSDAPDPPKAARPTPAAGMDHLSAGAANPSNNNYARPSGQQNVGNFLTDKPSSKVLAPPGGKSQFTFG